MFEERLNSIIRNEVVGTPVVPGHQDVLVRLVAVAKAAASGDRAGTKHTLEKAIAMLSGGDAPYISATVALQRGALAPWQEKLVTKHIHAHIGDSLRTTGLAALVRLSTSHFSRCFKASFHDTPMSYVMRQRIRLAQDMMLSTREPLAEIALRCGLCDQAHFSRLFRRFVGESPRSWRRHCAYDLAPADVSNPIAHLAR